MSIYSISKISEILKDNTYPGRGIVIGKTEDGTKAVAAYFIMGRSENSRNRIFEKKANGDIFTKAFDESKLEDPSLIIYNAIRAIDNNLIVTNGDQTDTVYDFLANGLKFEDALNTREFEPDMPNFTPRISGMLTFDNYDFSYKMSILKSADEKGSACNRHFFNYKSLNGLGHFIHTYNHDGNPIPTFTGEPERVSISNNIDDFTSEIWNALNSENKISLTVKFVDLSDGTETDRIINKNK